MNADYDFKSVSNGSITKYECSTCHFVTNNKEVMITHCMAHDVSDPINPPHYNGRDVMDIINQFELGFCLGNVVKYVLRERRKNGVVDLKKALWYLNEEISKREVRKDAASTR